MLHSVESDIRSTSMLQKNAYLVAIFACCRENHSKLKHSSCVSADSYAAAKEIFEERDEVKN